ncbi:MAG: M48 family metalloprotease, partial [Chloroflexi bacterium]|nr:M48 family metalloprotease [Chloroflexota bacterium]
HELSHVGNYDIRVMTIVVVLVGLSALMADFALRLTFYGAGRRSSNRGRSGGGAVAIIYAIALLAVILTPIAAQLIRFAVSRQREYLADASGRCCAATRKPLRAPWRRYRPTPIRWRWRTRRPRTCTSTTPCASTRAS